MKKKNTKKALCLADQRTTVVKFCHRRAAEHSKHHSFLKEKEEPQWNHLAKVEIQFPPRKEKKTSHSVS